MYTNERLFTNLIENLWPEGAEIKFNIYKQTVLYSIMGVGSSTAEVPGGGSEGYHVLRVSSWKGLRINSFKNFRPI